MTSEYNNNNTLPLTLISYIHSSCRPFHSLSPTSIWLDTQPISAFATAPASFAPPLLPPIYMSPAGCYHPSPYSSPRERLRKVDEVEDDKQSTLSHSSGVPRADQGKDALRLVAGNRVRHARCAPEFLEEIANKGVPDSLRKATSKKFKFITGSDARTFFKNYIMCAYYP